MQYSYSACASSGLVGRRPGSPSLSGEGHQHSGHLFGKLFLFVVLAVLSANAASNDWDMENDPVDVVQLCDEGWYVSDPLTVPEVEQRSIEWLAASGSHVPMVPFGGRHTAWEAFKASIQKGDEIVFFRSPPDTWKGLYGRSGYALVRDGNVVNAILTLVN
jgi:hypothetical protein